MNKGLATRTTVRPGRSDCHSAVVPDSQQQASVHGCQGTVLKRLAVTNGMNKQAGGSNSQTRRDKLSWCECRGEGPGGERSGAE